MTPEPTIDEIINILKQNNFSFDNKIYQNNELSLNLKQIQEKKENLSPNNNYENINGLFNEDYAGLFNKDNNNNDINFRSLRNKNFNFNLAKDSLFCDFYSFGDMGDFNCEKYRNMLKNWADKIFHNTMKNYASVVQYYLDKLQEEKNNMTSMYIL